VSELLYLIAQILYDQEPDQWMRLDQMYLALPGRDEGDIDAALQSLSGQRLIKWRLQIGLIQLSAVGRDAWNDGLIVEQTLGMHYVAERYGPATVHIIVTGVSGENAGSGFFSADYPGRIITAAHVIRERTILRIENLEHEVVAGPLLNLRYFHEMGGMIQIWLSLGATALRESIPSELNGVET
jgi:S1-C subfamily serine protease